MLKLGEIITLNNNKEYIVASTTVHENNNYAYLVEYENNENTKIYLVNENELTEVINKNLIDELENLFVSIYNV